MVGLTILLAFCLGTLTVALRRARRGDPLGWLVFLFMVFYLLLNLTNALTQEYFQPPFVIILIALGLMASGPAPDPATCGGITAITTGRTADERAKDTKPKSPSP